jgi:hypothetical protein
VLFKVRVILYTLFLSVRNNAGLINADWINSYPIEALQTLKMKAFKIETSTVPVIENMRQNLLFLNPDFNQHAFI